MTTRKKLYRSRRDKMLGGVCAGIAEYFGIDTTLVRLIFAFMFFGMGIGFLPYLVMWIVIPEEPDYDELIIDEKPKRNLI